LTTPYLTNARARKPESIAGWRDQTRELAQIELLHQQVALVTGGSKGLGAAVAAMAGRLL